MRTVALIGLLTLASFVTAQGLDRKDGKIVQQFARTMKPDRSKNEVEFFAADDRNYIVELEATGFKPVLKILRTAKNTSNIVATGKKIDANTLRADLITPGEGTLKIQVAGEEAYPNGTYRLSVWEIMPKKR